MTQVVIAARSASTRSALRARIQSEGIHILVPIARRHTYAQTREFSEIVAGAIARAHPGLATTEWTKAKRRGVLIDSNQNGEGKTIASAYSVRPKAGAPVSTPLHWYEVNESLDPSAFTMEVVLDRVGKEGDLEQLTRRARARSRPRRPALAPGRGRDRMPAGRRSRASGAPRHASPGDRPRWPCS